jgi:hypothetical protein
MRKCITSLEYRVFTSEALIAGNYTMNPLGTAAWQHFRHETQALAIFNRGGSALGCWQDVVSSKLGISTRHLRSHCSACPGLPPIRPTITAPSVFYPSAVRLMLVKLLDGIVPARDAQEYILSPAVSCPLIVLIQRRMEHLLPAGSSTFALASMAAQHICEQEELPRIKPNPCLVLVGRLKALRGSIVRRGLVSECTRLLVSLSRSSQRYSSCKKYRNDRNRYMHTEGRLFHPCYQRGLGYTRGNRAQHHVPSPLRGGARSVALRIV